MKKLSLDLLYGIIITAIGWLVIRDSSYNELGLFIVGVGSLITSITTIAIGVNMGINSTKEDNI